MNTEVIAKMLMSDVEEDWKIAYSIVENNNDDIFEFLWVVSCLHTHTAEFYCGRVFSILNMPYKYEKIAKELVLVIGYVPHYSSYLTNNNMLTKEFQNSYGR